MRSLPILVLACGVLSQGFAASHQPEIRATVQLAERATVSGPRIKLGSISRIDTADPELSQKLDAVLVGLAPAPGQSRVMERSEVGEALALAGYPPWEIQLTGASTIQLTRFAQVVPESRLTKALTGALARELSVREADIAFRRLQFLTTPRVGGGSIELEVEFLDPPRLELALRARVMVRVDGVASAHVDAELEVVERARTVERPVARPSLRRQPNARVIKSGQQVVIELEGPGLQITALGRARRSGGLGDEIPVENMISGIVVRGIVKGAGRVQVFWSPITGLDGVKER